MKFISQTCFAVDENMIIVLASVFELRFFSAKLCYSIICEEVMMLSNRMKMKLDHV